MTNAEYLRQLRAKAAQRGLCYVCRCRFPRPGLRVCEECKARHAKWEAETPKGRASVKKHSAATTRRSVARRKSAGLCVHCGRRPSEPGYSGCSVCLDSIANRVRDQRRSSVETAPRTCSVCGSPDHQAHRHRRAGLLP